MKPLQSKKFYPITTTLMVVLLSMVFSANVRAQSCCEGTQAQTAKTIFVTPSGNDANDGRSWDTAKKSLRSALNSTSAGDIIQVAQGEYFENINLADGINLLGGFIPGGTVRTPYGSIINGGGKGTVIKASNVNNCILDGFTIKNGNYESGGGLFIQGGSLTISRNLIENNQAGVGGGAYLAGFRGKFSRNTVRANTASVGGGIYCSGLRAEAVIERNDISGNNADNSGAGLYLSSSSGGVQNNTISNNTVPKGPGGAVYVADFSGLFSNNLLHHNTANVGAGGYLVDISSGGSFLNNTIADNSAGGTGGGVMFGNFAGEIRNCIIWGNTSDTNHQIFSNEASNRITYSNIEGGYTGTGNLNTDPLFSADYQLAGGSPSINAGSDGTNMGHTGGQAQRVNRGPVAVCPGNTTVDIATDKKYCDGADVLLSGCNSYDPDGDPLTYLWTWEGGSAVGKCVKPFFGLGAHAVTLTVSDGEFDSSCSFEVNITCTAVCSIKILEPANGYCFTDLNDNNPQITVRGIVASGKPCEVYVGGILTTVDANGNFSVNIPLTGGQGQYEIAASAAVCGTQCADEILITYDETPPQITCPGNITIEQQDNSGFPASKLPDAFKAAATDNVDTHPTITDDRPDTFPVGDTTVTFVATDYCGHSSQCEAVVTVKDTIVPVFGGTTTPTTITIEQEVIEGTPKTSSRLTDFFDVIAADNVDGVISVENNAPDIFPPDCTPVTFKACDTAGNCSEFIKTVCVDDTTSPVMVKPADITLECGGACTASSLLPPEFICTATDAVDGESGVTSDAPECLPLGETAITFCATDNSGNQACCTAAVTVIDTAAPRFSRTATTITIEQEGKDGTKANSAQLSDFFNVTAADVCDGAVVAGNNAPVIFPPGCTDVTFTACDQSGNCAVMKDSVCDYDTAAPAITCPSDLALKCTGGCTPLPDGTVFAATAIDAVDGEL
ncbi:MAG: HYR domain-containing protein, partial [Candidatus Schekmanbacteria bacterium]|nr:HYR domain-containing protein [Candidatus Schekmanbacteria bacterium]